MFSSQLLLMSGLLSLTEHALISQEYSLFSKGLIPGGVYLGKLLDEILLLTSEYANYDKSAIA
jgi:hypothetical protein